MRPHTLLLPFFWSSTLLAAACCSPSASSSLAPSDASFSSDASPPSSDDASPGPSPDAPTGVGGDASADAGDRGTDAAGTTGGASPRSALDCTGDTVCETFENFATGAVPDAGPVWTVSAPDCSGTSTLAIDTTQAHSGRQSLKVVGTAGYCNHIFLETTAPEQLTAGFWVRFYVRFEAALTNDHATYLAMKDSSSGKNLRMGGQDGVMMWNRETDDATLPAMSPLGTAESIGPSVGTWHCVEFHSAPSPTGLATWVDGAPIVGMSLGDAGNATADSQWMSGSVTSPTLTDVRFGWESYASETETLWFDDIAINAVRIGCE